MSCVLWHILHRRLLNLERRVKEDYWGEICWILWIVFASRHKYLHHHHHYHHHCPTAVAATWGDTSTVDQSMPGYPPGRTSHCEQRCDIYLRIMLETCSVASLIARDNWKILFNYWHRQCWYNSSIILIVSNIYIFENISDSAHLLPVKQTRDCLLFLDEI